MTILPLTYLGSIEWFARLAAGGAGEGGAGCVIDIGENWMKQTARNRCEIMTSSGVAALTVPVHGGGLRGEIGGGAVAKIATKDIRIDNSKRWQHEHWQSMVSAYRNSPYFDHYEERFAPIYTGRRLNFLTDLNLELLNILTSVLGISPSPQISENYIVASLRDVDLRGKKSLRRLNDLTRNTPGTPDFSRRSEYGEAGSAGRPVHGIPKYTQVFSDRIEFVGGLSVIDLLFCEGPAAAGRLYEVYR